VRNVICCGADPERIAVLDNFCWPRCDDPAQLGSLVRAAEACYDGALAYRTPFVSGKDSLSNQFSTDDGRLITIPPTLLISALGIVPDVTTSRTMDAKRPGNLLLIVGQTTSALGGSHVLAVADDGSRNRQVPVVDLRSGPAAARAVAGLIAAGLIDSAHDCSDGGVLVAAAEMAFAGGIGLDLQIDQLPVARELDDLTACFAETPSRYLLEIQPRHLDAAGAALRRAGLPFAVIGTFAGHQRLTVRCARHGRLLDEPLDSLRQAWRQPLDW
jgi:phosphoribosylformylglycinamidine synthase